MITLDTADASYLMHEKPSGHALSVIPQTSPAHMMAVAHLYGIQAPALEKARVLELGCGTGGNLLPFVLAYENSHAIGIDLDDLLIEQGLRTLQALSVPNLQLAAVGLDDLLSSDLGKFDYIIIHGHFATINKTIRTALLSWVKGHLAEQGVACISWSTYPGYKTAEVLQDALQLHSSLAQTPDERVSSARAMLTFMSLGLSTENPMRGALQEWVKHADSSTDLALSLRYLQNLNEPSYLVDFYATVVETGFAYVGDLLPHTELAAHYGSEVEKLHRIACPNDNKLLGQQYLDFATGRSQRFSLLVQDARSEDILPVPDLQRLKDFHWGSSVQRVVLDDGQVANAYRLGLDMVVHINHELALNMMDVISDAWPHSVSFDQLAFNTQAPENDGDVKRHQEDVLQALQMLFMKGITGLHFRLGEEVYNRCTQTSVQLLPSVAALWQGNLVAHVPLQAFNFWHNKVELTFNRQEITYLEKLLRKETDPPLQNDCYILLERLRIAGVLWGNVSSWKHYFQQLLQVFPSKSERYLGALIIYTSESSVGGYKCHISGKKSHKTADKSIVDAKPLNDKVYQQILKSIETNEFAVARNQAATLVKKMPLNIHCWHLLGQTNLKTGAYDDALVALMKTLSMHASSWDIYLDVARIFWHTNKHFYAGRLIRKILRCDKYNSAAWNALGALYKSSGFIVEAEFCLRKALTLLPQDCVILNNLADLLSVQGRMTEAASYFRRIRTIAPNDSALYSTYLFTLSHDVTQTPASLFAEHCKFGELVERQARQYKRTFIPMGSKEPERKLKIGFVSGDLYAHPVMSFLRPIWDSIDRERFSLHAFSTSVFYDEATQSAKKTAQGWHDVFSMSDLELADLIHQEQIDILFDLSGHTGYNRLPMFAFKPAPIQISWIGYPGTTGMSAMDYFLILNLEPLPEKFSQQFREKILYARSIQQFIPVADSPAVNELPAIKRGGFTFGSMNRMQKLNDYIFDAWATILKRVANSRIIIGALSGQKNIDLIREKLELLGVKPEQLIFQEKMEMHAYLALHNEIDLLLDTYPYTGGTTTNHALWMGVPTLTIAGETFPTRQGVAALQWLGLDGFVASSKEDYVAKAIGWSERLDELNQYRQDIRSRFDRYNEGGITPATHFETILRMVWKNYCEDKTPQSHSIGY